MIVQSFWFGGVLSPYEALCIRSFLDHGHGYELYTYDLELAVPAGAVRRDAAEILPRDRLFLAQGGLADGSVAIFADWFRYELLRQRGGWWVDTDVVCRTGTLPQGSVFFALEKPGRVNCAILRFPAGHPVPAACAAEAARLGATGPWGTTGPRLITAVLDTQGLLEAAAPAATCYPFDWNEVPLLFDPAGAVALALRLDGAVMFHIWNEMLRRAGISKWVGVPEGCYLDRLFADHAIAFPAYPRYRTEDVKRLDGNRRGVDRLAELESRAGQLHARVSETEQQLIALRAELERQWQRPPGLWRRALSLLHPRRS
jgi:hypothetical protein